MGRNCRQSTHIMVHIIKSTTKAILTKYEVTINLCNSYIIGHVNTHALRGTPGVSMKTLVRP